MDIQEIRKIIIFSASSALIMLIMKDEGVSSYIFFSILIISAAYSVFSAKGFNKNFVTIMENTTCTLTLSLTISVCFYIVWSYLILPDRFLNIFIIQYSVLLPSLVVLFASILTINSVLRKRKLKHKKVLKNSVLAAACISILISVAYLASVNYIYKQKINVFDKIYDGFLDEVSELTRYYDNNLEVFKEIKIYQEGIVEEAGYMKDKFLDDYSKRGLCIKSNCAENIGSVVYYTAKIIVEPEIIKGSLKRADEIKNDLEGENEQEGDSFKEILELLEKKINSSASDRIPHNSNIYSNDMEVLVETDFSYMEFFDIIKKRKNLQEATNPVFYFRYSDVFDRDSLFYSSVYNTFFHTKEFKELMKLLVKFSTYTSRNEVLVNLYSNRYADESDESKMIRFKIILSSIGE